MPAIINYKICDNAKECSGIEVCPTKAIFYDEKKRLIIDEKKCINCGKCIKTCPAQAIKMAVGDEYKKIKKEIEEDKRKITDLFIERYGAQSVDKNFLINEDGFNNLVFNSKKLTIGEFFNEKLVRCLIYSIPIKELFNNKDIEYYKVEVGEKYKNLPFLVFYKNGKCLGKIEGYFENREKKKLIEKIKEIIK